MKHKDSILQLTLTEIIFNLVSWLKKERTRLKLRRRGSFSDSSIISLLFRPILERRKVRSLMGAPLMAALVIGTPLMPGIENDLSQSVAAQVYPDQVLEFNLQNIHTVSSDPYYKLPVTDFFGISQYYQLGHPALDLRAAYGSPVLSMDHGIVSQVIHERFGYGKHIIIQHKDGIESVYAHLELTLATEGQIIESGDLIGSVGMTGWTTGPHLHFEVRENGIQVNPLVYIKPALEEWQQGKTSSDVIK